MVRYNRQNAIKIMNKWGGQNTPFAFIIDFEMEKIITFPLDDIPKNIHMEINGKSYGSNNFTDIRTIDGLDTIPISKKKYEKAFQEVITEISYGNSFLLNLAFPTELLGKYPLDEIYQYSHAKYKLLIEDECVVFSPEIFIQIKDGNIHSYPMKGTIDASIPNAKEKILKDYKEVGEHYTIVDLIRNDLSMVAKEVRVERFRYVDRIHTNHKDLLQVSSEIVGSMSQDYHNHIGTIIFKLLPAGSICGAPKKKTVEIIKSAEGMKRGYYTGIMGVYDGKDLDAGVMIRYIEKVDGRYYFRSGGGITYLSELDKEYDEMLDKVYLPYNLS